MKYITLLLFIALVSMKSCDKNGNLSQEEEQQRLDAMYTEIQAMANSEPCVNAEDWTFTAIGAKACGGPMGYIAYSTKMDTEAFLEKVEEYTKKQDEFNKKWNIISDCMVPPTPQSVRCVDGKAELVY